MKKYLYKYDNAVSAVIGVILIVAITVAVAATVYVYVSGYGVPDPPPQLSYIASKKSESPKMTIIRFDSDGHVDWDDLSVKIDGIPVDAGKDGDVIAGEILDIEKLICESSQSSDILVYLEDKTVCTVSISHKDSNTLIAKCDFSLSGNILDAIEDQTSEDWYDKSWNYRKLITIDHDKIDADLVNFPVLINIIDLDLEEKVEKINGEDILFTDDSENQLNHEIESYDSDTGNLVAWVNIPSLSFTEDTKIWMYYGNDVTVNNEDVEGTWNDNFVMVNHMDESNFQGPATLYDSTQYDNDGTLQGDRLYVDLGKMAGAYFFDGTGDHISTLGGPSLNPQEFTYEAWIRRATNDDTEDHIISDGFPRQFYVSNRNIIFQGIATGVTIINKDEWYHVAFTYDGVAGTIYLNGDEEISNEKNLNLGSGTLQIARCSECGDGMVFNGDIDEARVSNIALSAEWISASFNNQNLPDTFLEFGAEEIL